MRSFTPREEYAMSAVSSRHGEPTQSTAELLRGMIAGWNEHLGEGKDNRPSVQVCVGVAEAVKERLQRHRTAEKISSADCAHIREQIELHSKELVSGFSSLTFTVQKCLAWSRGQLVLQVMTDHLLLIAQIERTDALERKVNKIK